MDVNNTGVNGTLLEFEKGVVSDWMHVVSIVYMCLVFVFGVPGNALVMVVQLKKNAKSSTDYYVLLMAITDLIGSALIAPLYVLRNLKTFWLLAGTKSLCQLHFFITLQHNVASTLLLTALAYERYRLTCHPFLKDMRRLQKSILFCMATVLFSVAFAACSIPMIGIDKTTYRCRPLTSSGSAYTVIMSVMALIFICMFVVISVCYTKVSTFLRRRYRLKVTQLRSKLKQSAQGRSSGGEDTFGNMVEATSPVNPHAGHQTAETSLCQTIKLASIVGSERSVTADGDDEYTTVKTIMNGRRLRNNVVAPVPSASTGNDACRDGSSTLENRAMLLIPARLPISTRQYVDTTRVSDAEIRYINKVTLMMFFISIVYIGTWVFNWTVNMFARDQTQSVTDMAHLIRSDFMINCVSNPFFYISMSSKFRQHAKSIFTK